MYASAGSFSVGKASMVLPKHRRLIGCEVDRSRETKMRRWLILPYARQVLSKESEVDGEEEARSSAEMYLKGVEEIEARHFLDSLKVAEGLSPMRAPPSRILHPVCTYFRVEALFQKPRTILGNQYSGK